jgi:hypothetical protein
MEHGRQSVERLQTSWHYDAKILFEQAEPSASAPNGHAMTDDEGAEYKKHSFLGNSAINPQS